MLAMSWLSPVLIGAMLATAIVPARAGDPGEKPRPDRAASEQRTEEWSKLSPEEREARMKEWRKTNSVPSREEREKRREQFQKMTPEERDAKRKEIKGRLEKRIAELRRKQADATITAPESRELNRSEQILKRFEQNLRPPSSGARTNAVEKSLPEQK
jgi:hypothetical protein